MFCTKCGQKNSDNARFCIGCGAKFSVPDVSVKQQKPVEKKEPEKIEENGARGRGIWFLIAVVCFIMEPMIFSNLPSPGIIRMVCEIALILLPVVGCGCLIMFFSSGNSKLAKIDRKLEEKAAIKLGKTEQEVLKAEIPWLRMIACFLAYCAGVAFIFVKGYSVMGKKLSPFEFIVVGVGISNKKIAGVPLETEASAIAAIIAGFLLFFALASVLVALLKLHYLINGKNDPEEVRAKLVHTFWKNLIGGAIESMLVLAYPVYFMAKVKEYFRIPDLIADFIFKDSATSGIGFIIMLFVILVSSFASRKSSKIFPE